ncbi:hypothetical protein EJB05_09605, partial [Eragrostis curvula]
MQAMASARAILLLFPTTAASPPSACPSSTNRARHRTLLMCRAAGAGSDYRVDRRDVLAGLTGVAAGGLGAYPNLAFAESDAADNCFTGDKVTGGLLTCPPFSSSAAAVDFTPHTGAPTRVRQPAHLADASLVEKYNLALAEMRALPDSDPRSFASQAAIHQAYCDGHYRLAAGDDQATAAAAAGAPFDVHFSWVFAPWHRMYIYFYERILGGLIGDPNFALPYWNWDAPADMALPEMFKDPTSPQYDANRNPDHVDAYLVLDYLKPAGDSTYKRSSARSTRRTRRRARPGRWSRRRTRACTSGWATRRAARRHDAVRQRHGLPRHGGARPGLLYSHHANVDRLWHLWNSTLGGRNFADGEWLDTSFAFYDETPRLVGVRVRDVLDAAKLGYTYAADEPLLWLGRRPTVRRDKKRKGELEAVVFDGVEFDPAAAAKFDVAINVPPELAGGGGPRCVEYAGSFASLPRGGGEDSGGTMLVPLELPVEDVLNDIGVTAGGGNAVDVVIVPRTLGITITSPPRIESRNCDPASA